MLKKLYAGLCVVGFVLPYIPFTLFMLDHNFNLGRFVQALFANNATTMFTMDLLISSLVFWLFLFYDSRRLRLKNVWLYVTANLLVGLSLALPLFLYFREVALEAPTHQG